MAYPCFAVESLSDWVAVSPQSQAFTLPAPEMAVRVGEVGGDGTACMACIVWPFQPGRARCAESQPCGPGKVRRVRLDQCACPAAWLPWSVLPVRGEVEQAGLLSSGAFWRNIPLSAVLLSCFVESAMALPCLLNECGLLSWLFSFQAISEARTEESS